MLIQDAHRTDEAAGAQPQETDLLLKTQGTPLSR